MDVPTKRLIEQLSDEVGEIHKVIHRLCLIRNDGPKDIAERKQWEMMFNIVIGLCEGYKDRHMKRILYEIKRTI